MADQSEKELSNRLLLAFDTANEVVAIGLGLLAPESRSISPVATLEVAAHRASNTSLLPSLEKLMADAGLEPADIACVACGRGPGSFTGVRIAMATAKGIASALEVGLIGLSTLDAVAWKAWFSAYRGELLVLADAMRKEVYPVRYRLGDQGPVRLEADHVIKEGLLAENLQAEDPSNLLICGDGLVKYLDDFAGFGEVLPEKLWTPTGDGLLLGAQELWREGSIDPYDPNRHDPAMVLPVYTRLSDAEEHERARLASPDPRNLWTGVNDALAANDGSARHSMHADSVLSAPEVLPQVRMAPLNTELVAGVAELDNRIFSTEAWSEQLFCDELKQRDRSWWVALAPLEGDASWIPVGFAGAMVVDGDSQVLKIALDPAYRRRGIGRELLLRVSDDARNLGADRSSLEVRASNRAAQAFYESFGYRSLGTRPGYEGDGKDALILEVSLPLASLQKSQAVHEVSAAGMVLEHHEHNVEYQINTGANLEADIGVNVGSDIGAVTGSNVGVPALKNHPFILAIESSCDETAAALIDGSGHLLSDIVASQIDFHARFGGVVPEIASRKHIEVICGVVNEALKVLREREVQSSPWEALDAVAATYAPGLVGALVVGVAFAKGVAWARHIPYIEVNHLEGHLFANKLAAEDFSPPAVVSLVSGGNTMLVFMRDWNHYETLGATIDDAVGEAFDKVAKALGLGYPGGPVISRQASQGDPFAIDFPRAMLHSGDYRFSLSGLKTAVVNYINQEREAGSPLNIPNIAASFQQAVIDVQIAKARSALEETGAPRFCLGGGVAANPALRQAYELLCADLGVELLMPPLASCGDNAGMIALVALDRYRQGKFADLASDAHAHGNLDEPY